MREQLEILTLADQARWQDLQTVFGTRGPASRCQCQRYKPRPRESFGSFPVEERAYRRSGGS